MMIKPMKKRFLLILFFSIVVMGQQGRVGVNTTSPSATLDVSALRNSTTGEIESNNQPYGLQAPRLTRAELTNNTFNWGASQKGALIYITDVSNGDTAGARVNISSIGYYYFDGNNWQKIIDQSSSVNLYTNNGDIAPSSGIAVDRNVGFTGGGSLNFDQNTLYIDATNNVIGMGTNQPNPNALLDLSSINKALLLPRIANTGAVSSPVNGMMVYDISSNCIKSYENSIWTPCLSALNNLTFAKLVYVNAANPSSATIFDTINPASNNDNSLKQDSNNLYVANNGQSFTWNGTTYTSYTPPSTTAWFLNGTSTDAGGDKTNIITRNADVISNGVRIGRGSGNVSTNTLIGGGGALSANTTGDNNVALGEYALGSNTTGTSNFGMGFASLGNNTTGSFNVGLGRASLRWSNGNYNIGIGMQALSGNGMTGSSNIGIGWLAGISVTTGGSNIAIGTSSGGASTGSRNITIGVDATVPTNTANGQINIGNSLFATNATSTSVASPLGNWGVGISNPTERLTVNGALKVGNPYSGVTNGATTPIPNGGAGTIVFNGTNFFGWNGTAWRQLDN